MTEFKIGDRVRAYGRVGTIVCRYNIGWNVRMDNAPHTPERFSGWYYHDYELELIESDPRDIALDRIVDALREHTHADDWNVDCIYVSNLWPVLQETGRH